MSQFQATAKINVDGSQFAAGVRAAAKQLDTLAGAGVKSMSRLGKVFGTLFAGAIMGKVTGGFTNAIKEAERLGVTLDKGVLAQMSNIENQFGAVGIRLKAAIAPVLDFLVKRLTDARAAFAFFTTWHREMSDKSWFDTDAMGAAFVKAQEAGGEVYRQEAELASRPFRQAEATDGTGSDPRTKAADALFAARSKVAEQVYEELSASERLLEIDKARLEITKALRTAKTEEDRLNLLSMALDLEKERRSVLKSQSSAPTLQDQLPEIFRPEGLSSWQQLGAATGQRAFGDLASLSSAASASSNPAVRHLASMDQKLAIIADNTRAQTKSAFDGGQY